VLEKFVIGSLLSVWVFARGQWQRHAVDSRLTAGRPDSDGGWQVPAAALFRQEQVPSERLRIDFIAKRERFK
jgi:hypothetical protein